jgi:hypothetical protein
VHRVSAALLSFVLVLGLVPIAAAGPAEGAPAVEGAPAWAREASIYQVFVDRFRDGDPDNNVDVDDSSTSARRSRTGWVVTSTG